MVEPVGVAFLGNAVADEGEARGAEGDEFVGVDGEVGRELLLPKVASEAPYLMKLPAIQ